MDIDKIAADGYYLNRTAKHISNVGFIALRNSLISYFQTYRSLGSPLRVILDEQRPDEEIDSNYGIGYIGNCCQAITNFHHFVELILKDILNDKHPLLTIDASTKHETLHDLIFGINVDNSLIEKTRQVEFSVALDRIISLIRVNKIDKNKYQFIVEGKSWLEKLNNLRNRIAHRGIFVIRYKSLDYLFGQFALPFLLKISSLPEYNSMNLWKYKTLHSGIDPITEIVNTSSSGPNYESTKIALLKELGYSAYQNHLRGKVMGMSWDDEAIKRAETLATHVHENEYAHEIETCPVCGVKSLVLFNDSYDESDEEGNTLEYYEFVYSVECFCCSFQLSSEITGMDRMRLPIENYWKKTR